MRRFSLVRTTIFTALVFILMTSPIIRAELATPTEMDRAGTNWVTQMVAQKGEWAGETAPQIVGRDELRSGDTLLAVVYHVQPRGFVLVSALKEMTPVKIYSDESNLDITAGGDFLEMITEQLSERMSLYARAFGSLEATQPSAGDVLFDRENAARWERLTKPTDEFARDLSLRGAVDLAEAGPLTTSSWNQQAPYNNLCPMGDEGRCVVGCVATAAAQVMYYWQWPANGVGSHTYTWDGDQYCGGDYGGGDLTAYFSDPYDWANMVDSCDAGCSPEASAALAELNYEVGVAFDMDYSSCGSGASVSRALTVYPTWFKYSPDIRREDRIDNSLVSWFTLIQEEINAGRVIQYRINKHSIVCDGWREQTEQYEYHMNYGWAGSSTAWYVLDNLYCYWVEGDICPADEEFMITHIQPQTEPIISYVGQVLDDSAGDSDGHADVGESGSLSVTVINRGWDAANAVGVLTTGDPYVNVTASTASFGTLIPWGDEAGSETDFEFSVDPSCPDPHVTVFELTVTADGGYTAVDTLYLFIGESGGFTDDMESGEGYWTHAPVLYTYYDQWHRDTTHPHDGDFSWKAGGPDTLDYVDMHDGGLVTPPLLLPVNPQLSFWHWIDAEIDTEPGWAWDGGVVMISSGDGNWTQLTPDGGYTYSIVDNPASPFAAGTPCFAGSDEWTEAVFDLSAYSGVVQLMFRFGSDGYTTAEGWYIDDVAVTSLGCCVIRGDVDQSGALDISDLTYYVDYMFAEGPAPICEQEGDFNADGVMDISDLTFYVDYMFNSGPPPPDCVL